MSWRETRTTAGAHNPPTHALHATPIQGEESESESEDEGGSVTDSVQQEREWNALQLPQLFPALALRSRTSLPDAGQHVQDGDLDRVRDNRMLTDEVRAAWLTGFQLGCRTNSMFSFG